MTEDVHTRRSQAILRLPIDSILATLVLHDGERSDVLLFMPPGDRVADLLSPGDPFVSMIRNARFCLVARDAIAVIAMVIGAPAADDGALPLEHQRVRIRLRSGSVVEGEMQWISTEGHRRTADHVNDPAPFLVVHALDVQTAYYIAKSHVAIVEEV
ncbi:MAG: hypothetical protein H7138_09460 [Myxococcales bacterium]|nr:hypothetical protein [Myxococcales bacterium]